MTDERAWPMQKCAVRARAYLAPKKAQQEDTGFRYGRYGLPGQGNKLIYIFSARAFSMMTHLRERFCVAEAVDAFLSPIIYYYYAPPPYIAWRASHAAMRSLVGAPLCADFEDDYWGHYFITDSDAWWAFMLSAIVFYWFIRAGILRWHAVTIYFADWSSRE